MAKIGILAGNHEVGRHFCEIMLDKHRDNIAFVQQEGGMLLPPDIPCFTTTSELWTRHCINVFEPDLIVLAWWPKIVHHIQTLGIPIINTHPSYLPYGRGKFGYCWSIIKGEPFGVTLHRVDDGVDTGDVLYQRPIELTPEDTAESAYRKGVDGMKDLLDSTVDVIVANCLPESVPQSNLGESTSYHSSCFVDTPITEDDELMDFINDCRGRTFDNPRSGRRVIIDGKIYRIHLKLVAEE